MSDERLAATIRSLTAELVPVAPVGRPSMHALGWGAAALLSVAAGTLLFGPRRDLWTIVASPVWLGLAGCLVAAAVGTSIAALRLSVPGADRRVLRSAAVMFLPFWMAMLLSMHATRGGGGADLMREPLHVSCTQTIAAVAIVPAVLLALMLHRGFVLRAGRAAALAGIAAASTGALAVTLTCPINRPSHLIVAHALPTAVLAVLLMLLVLALARQQRARLVLAVAVVLLTPALVAAQHVDPPAPSHSLPPFEVIASTGGYIPTDTMLEFLQSAQAGPVAARPLSGRGPVVIGLAILLGGLLLNLTPCVLPMIPINLAIIGAGGAAASKRRGWILGGSYGLGMALAYGVLGGLVVVTAGTFGMLNASATFNLAIAVLFTGLALSMFDVFTLDLSRWSDRFPITGGGRGGVATAFAMGGVASLLAGACVAPVVIQVVALASGLYADGSRLALGLPLVLGIGMGLPWPFAGAGIAALPKPGLWMTRVKQGLGACIAVTALYYGYEAVVLFRPATQRPASSADGWYHGLDEALAASRREGKPIFLDVWATWCKNCVVMDATTFKNQEVRDALDRFVKIRFQAEDVESPDATALLDRLDSIGLPTYAVLRPVPTDSN